MNGHTTIAARFGWFAAGHFMISICVCAVFFFGMMPLSVLDLPVWAIHTLWGGTTTLALGIYFIVGAYTALTHHWTVPQNRTETVLAILLPTLVAWSWEGIALAGMSSALPDLAVLAGMLLYSALFLATPSVLFLFFCMGILGIGFQGEWEFWVMVVLAGLLPPLLFAAGSFWQAKRRPEETEESRMKRQCVIFTVLLVLVLSACGDIGEPSFCLSITQDCQNTVLGFHVEYALNGEPVGGFCVVNADSSPVKQGETMDLQVLSSELPDEADLSAFSFELYAILPGDRERSAGAPISLNARYGEIYRYSFTGGRDGLLAEK